ncbi:MAG: polyprenyl synthetase family protein [Dehalococcoidia bacterium]|nr:polyprenyl synthetase family protein [Dehalococcoidia bacterium]
MPAPLPVALARHLPAVETALQSALADGPAELVEIARYVLGWQDELGSAVTPGGKRIRPALCLFAATLFGSPPEVALPGAVAVELIHNFSLVHDDVQDRDAERHSRPTVWALKGEGQAINAGDFLITRAVSALLDGAGPASRRLAALAVLNDAMARMIYGQWQDIAFESRESVTPSEYLEMVRGKTGALLGAPLAMGALLAGADEHQARTLQRWGETVGLAFQVQDDYLGIWGDPNQTGKSTSSDILRRKKTLPIVHGLAGSAAHTIQRAYASAVMSEGELSEVVGALDAGGSREYSRSEADRLVAEAGALLAAFELPETVRQQLREIGAYLVDRDR